MARAYWAGAPLAARLVSRIRQDQPVTSRIFEHRVHRIQFGHERFRANCLSAGCLPPLAILSRYIADGSSAEKIARVLDEVSVPFSRAPGQFMPAGVKPVASQGFEIAFGIVTDPQHPDFVLQLL